MSVNVADPAQLQRLLDRTGLVRASDGVGYVLLQGGAAAQARSARWAHNPEVVGSNPTPATSREPRHAIVLAQVARRRSATLAPLLSLGVLARGHVITAGGFPNTEQHAQSQSGAVGLACEAPKGLGTAGYEPLMQNRTPALWLAAAIGLLPRTFLRESGIPQVRSYYGEPLPGAETSVLGVLLNKASKARLAPFSFFGWWGRCLPTQRSHANRRRHQLARWLSVSPQLRRMP